MKLDYENASSLEINRAIESLRIFYARFLQSGRKHDLHELVVKPKLDLLPGLKLVELGVGLGYHLDSYSGLNYSGYDTINQMVLYARKNAQRFGVNPDRISFRKSRVPVKDKTLDRLFSVCCLHESENPIEELIEMNRTIKPNGKILIVERMCAIKESPRAIEFLKKEPELIPRWFNDHGFSVLQEEFKASYHGESLSDSADYKFFLYLMQAKE